MIFSVAFAATINRAWNISSATVCPSAERLTHVSTSLLGRTSIDEEFPDVPDQSVLPARQRTFSSLAVCLAALTLPLSFQGGAIATPAIGRDLAGSAAMVAWITNALMFTFGSLLLTTGSPAGPLRQETHLRGSA
jgi:hypothetical protein